MGNYRIETVSCIYRFNDRTLESIKRMCSDLREIGVAFICYDDASNIVDQLGEGQVKRAAWTERICTAS